MITKEMILQRISQEDIINRYFPKPLVIDSFITNPFRGDNKSDCKFFYRNGTLLFLDFARREYSGDCFKIATIHFSLKKNKKIGFIDVLYLIDEDFGLNLEPKGFHQQSAKVVHSVKSDHTTKEKSIIECEVMDWNQFDIKYWSDRGITIETLEKYNVKPCYRVWVDPQNKGEIFTYRPRNLLYRYLIREPSDIEIYRPYASSSEKFRSNCKANIVQGWNQLPETGDLLIISKAYKDLMNFHEMGHPAVSFGSENTIPEDRVVKMLTDRFKNVLVIYDEDEAGIKASEILNERFGFPYWFIPKEYKVKDLNDFILKYDYEKFNNIFNIEKIFKTFGKTL